MSESESDDLTNMMMTMLVSNYYYYPIISALGGGGLRLRFFDNYQSSMSGWGLYVLLTLFVVAERNVTICRQQSDHDPHDSQTSDHNAD